MARALRTDLSNFHLLHYRTVDGFLVTGKNSGTHWLRCMLSHAMARQFDLPPPERTSGRGSEDFIAHPRWPQKHAGLPRIGSSHTIPSAIAGAPLMRRLFDLPPVVVLVRSIPDAMLSHWVKWGEAKELTLSDYVRLPAPGRRDIADVWWYLDFFNRWGAMAHACPGDVLIVRYEDLREDAGPWLARIAAHLGVSLSEEAIKAALDASAMEFVRDRLDPAYGEDIVPDRQRRTRVDFTAADRAYLNTLLAERLRFSFGYGLAVAHRPLVTLGARAPQPKDPQSGLHPGLARAA